MSENVIKPEWDYRLDIISSVFKKFTCNYRCPFCHKDYFLQSIHPSEKMHELTYGIKLCQSFLRGKFSIHIAGSGEPLCIPQNKFREFISPLMNLEDCISVSITTNGYYLSEYLNDIVALGINDINVSIPCLNAKKYQEIMKVDYNKAEDRIKKTKEGIIAARKKGLSVDLNVCVSYDIIDYLEDFMELSSEYDLKIKFFPIIAVPDLQISSTSHHFGNMIKYLTKMVTPSIESTGRYLNICWNAKKSILSAKPGDVYIRPYECYKCDDFLRCEESCWRSVRISPWYIQPCGIRKDNIYWYSENNEESLRRCLTQGGKLPERIPNHFELKQEMNKTINDDNKRNFPFIVIEGPDGSGKTEMVKRLSKETGFIYYRTPPQLFQKNDIKSALEQAGLEFARFLYYMSSNFYSNLEIRSLLMHGGIICDRWILSTKLYHDIALGLNVPLPEQLEDELLTPDLTIILNVSKKIQEERLKNRPVQFDEKWEDVSSLRDIINKAYTDIQGKNIIHISNEQSIDETLNDCLKALESYDIKY